MAIKFWVNIIVPVLAGIIYFVMAWEVKKVSKVRKLIFGELGFKKVFLAFVLFGIYFISRPLQNVMGPHPWPMLINCIRQFFIMGIIAPSVLVGIFYWDSDEGDVPKATDVASYTVGFLMAIIYILINRVAIDGSKIIATFSEFNLHDAMWFPAGPGRIELMLIHLFVQLVSPIGFFILAVAIVRRRRHNYPKDSVYNLMPLKWRYLEAGFEILVAFVIIAWVVALFGRYYTYLWVIYYIGAIISGGMVLKSIIIPPSEPPKDLKKW